MPNSSVIGTDELVRKFKKLDEAMQGEALANATLAGAKVISNAARENIQKQGLVRTRNLSRSINEEVEEKSAKQAVVAIGTNVEYAAIHEFGGVIKPKQGKYLAIPIGDRTGSPTKYGDLKIVKTRNGNLVMLDAGGQVQYLLKESVEVPARPYLRPALDEHINEAREVIGSALLKLIEQAVQ